MSSKSIIWTPMYPMRCFVAPVFRVLPLHILSNDMGTEALRLRP